MTSTIRFLFIVLLLVLVAAVLVANGGPTSAASAYSISVSPSAATFPVGGDGVFVLRLEGAISAYPSFDYQVQGGTLTGVVAANSTGPSTAEGAVHVSRETAGTARLTVSLAGQVVASSEATFVPMGTVSVRVQLDAGIDAAARTWRFEVANISNQVVATLSAGTSGDAPIATVTTSPLPYGFYMVRQVLGSDTATSCAGSAFYQVVAPVSGTTTVELASDAAQAVFEIRPCAALPGDLRVSIPIDTVAPGGFGPGVVGDADVFPGDAPVNEVRGARQAGDAPLPPGTGNSPGPLRSDGFELAPLLLVALFLLATPAVAWPVVAANRRSKR